jgi:hypothetical protein
MKEQKIVITDDEKEINGYIDRGWYIANMIPLTVSTGGNAYLRGKVCFLLEREK